MEFSFNAYKRLLVRIVDCGYNIADYHNWRDIKHPVILRHDIDYDIQKAVQLAAIEKIGGVMSTYFVLVTSDFYNIFSKESYDGLVKILGYGHEIALHFDEVRYPDCESNIERVAEHIQEEAELLGKCIGRKVDVVSMHRPSKAVLEANLQIPGIINSYSQMFFKEFKYLSDSRRRWREPIEEIIGSKEYERLHILTHAFWYADEEQDIHKTINGFINSGNESRYRWMSGNITDLGSIMSRDEIAGTMR